MRLVLEPKERYYSVREAAKILGLSKARVHQLVKARKLRIERVANAFVIPESELSRLRAEQRKPGRPKISKN